MNEQVCRVVSIQVERSGQIHSLAVGEGLRFNDRFAVTVQLDEGRYLYIARISLAGTRMLFPQEEAPPLQAPGAAIRIPAAAGWLRCPELKENEKLCLIAAKKRLDGDGDEDGPREGGQGEAPDKKGAINRTGFEQMIEIPVSR